MGDTVSRVTVTADASDEDADVAFLDDDDKTLDDADGDDTNGQQVDLAMWARTSFG